MSKISAIAIFFLLLFVNCKQEEREFFYTYNGKKIKVELISSNDTLTNGFGGEIYENGSLKSLAFFENGKIIDTLFLFHENGRIKAKGMILNKLKNGWWYFYDKHVNLKEKSEYIVIRDSIYKNQSYFFDSNGKIKIGPSTFFQLEIPDTLKIGKNIARVKKYVTNYNKTDDFLTSKNLLTVIVDNHYSEKEIRKDTFSDGTLKPFFGIYCYKTGKQKIKGILKETILR
jgi:hypothetical protein